MRTILSGTSGRWTLPLITLILLAVAPAAHAAGVCAGKANGTLCSDGNACTTGDWCQNSQCIGKSILHQPQYNTGNPCQQAVCNTATGVVSQKILIGKKCTDQNACTANDVCNAQAQCKGAPFNPQANADSNVCTKAVCNTKSGAVTQVLDLAATCSDNNACTYDDGCSKKSGVIACTGRPLNFADSDACTIDSCNIASGPLHTPMVCSGGATCQAGACVMPVKDTDGDGVTDVNDKCAGTAAGTKVDATGCPFPVLVKDADNDGTTDDKDLCPDTKPAEYYKLLLKNKGGNYYPLYSYYLDKVSGCSSYQTDTDGDGIVNALDLCLQSVDVPKDLYGNAVPDNDKDGIGNQCDIQLNIAGDAKHQGDIDSDGDGLFNYEDACANAVGLPEQLGCPDTDGDGTADKLDLCPQQSAPTGVAGCDDTDADQVADCQSEGPHVESYVNVYPGVISYAWDGCDLCLNLAGSAPSDNYRGCPATLDTDGDGLPDYKDLQPTIPTTLTVDSYGSNLDADGDSIADPDDQCPKDAGLKALKGCPDGDGDGLADGWDSCPTVAGALYGCPDTDKDWVKECAGDAVHIQWVTKYNGVKSIEGDGCDVCPGIKGYSFGCPSNQDSDGDGAPDYVDFCPKVPGISGDPYALYPKLNGCP